MIYFMGHCGEFGFRAYNIHIGAMFGTMMAFNVWFRIWPAQQNIITAIKNGEAPNGDDVALAGLSFRGGGKSTDEKFAKQWSEETEDDIMIYDEWKDTQELEGRGWDIIKTEFIFMDGLKLDHDG